MKANGKQQSKEQQSKSSAKMAIVYADSQFLLAAVDPSKVQYEIQGSNTRAFAGPKQKADFRTGEKILSCVVESNTLPGTSRKQNSTLQPKEEIRSSNIGSTALDNKSESLMLEDSQVIIKSRLTMTHLDDKCALSSEQGHTIQSINSTKIETQSKEKACNAENRGKQNAEKECHKAGKMPMATKKRIKAKKTNMVRMRRSASMPEISNVNVTKTDCIEDSFKRVRRNQALRDSRKDPKNGSFSNTECKTVKVEVCEECVMNYDESKVGKAQCMGCETKSSQSAFIDALYVTPSISGSLEVQQTLQSSKTNPYKNPAKKKPRSNKKKVPKKSSNSPDKSVVRQGHRKIAIRTNSGSSKESCAIHKMEQNAKARGTRFSPVAKRMEPKHKKMSVPPAVQNMESQNETGSNYLFKLQPKDIPADFCGSTPKQTLIVTSDSHTTLKIHTSSSVENAREPNTLRVFPKTSSRGILEMEGSSRVFPITSSQGILEMEASSITLKRSSIIVRSPLESIEKDVDVAETAECMSNCAADVMIALDEERGAKQCGRTKRSPRVLQHDQLHLSESAGKAQQSQVFQNSCSQNNIKIAESTTAMKRDTLKCDDMERPKPVGRSKATKVICKRTESAPASATSLLTYLIEEEHSQGKSNRNKRQFYKPQRGRKSNRKTQPSTECCALGPLCESQCVQVSIQVSKASIVADSIIDTHSPTLSLQSRHSSADIKSSQHSMTKFNQRMDELLKPSLGISESSSCTLAIAKPGSQVALENQTTGGRRNHKAVIEQVGISPLINIDTSHYSISEDMVAASGSGISHLKPQKKLLTATWNLSSDRPKWDATVDLYLHCEKDVFPVHRLVMVHFSQRLCNLLYGGNLPPKQVILVKRVSSDALREVLHWMYTGEINIMPHNTMAILIVALSLEIPELQVRCIRQLMKSGDPMQYMQLVHVARGRSRKDLASEAMTLVASMFSAIAKTDSFLKFSSDDVVLLLSWDTLNAKSEYDLYKAAIRWLAHDWPERRSYISKIMECVRFAYMNVATIDELLAAEEDDSVETKILKNKVVRTSLQNALLYKAYKAECISSDFRYPLLPPRTFISKTLFNLNAGGEKDSQACDRNSQVLNITSVCFEKTKNCVLNPRSHLRNEHGQAEFKINAASNLILTTSETMLHKVGTQVGKSERLVIEKKSQVTCHGSLREMTVLKQLSASYHASKVNLNFDCGNADVDAPKLGTDSILQRIMNSSDSKTEDCQSTTSIAIPASLERSCNDTNSNFDYSSKVDDNARDSISCHQSNENIIHPTSFLERGGSDLSQLEELSAADKDRGKLSDVSKQHKSTNAESPYLIVVQPSLSATSDSVSSCRRPKNTGCLPKTSSKTKLRGFGLDINQFGVRKVNYINTGDSEDSITCTESDLELLSAVLDSFPSSGDDTLHSDSKDTLNEASQSTSCHLDSSAMQQSCTWKKAHHIAGDYLHTSYTASKLKLDSLQFPYHLKKNEDYYHENPNKEYLSLSKAKVAVTEKISSINSCKLCPSPKFSEGHSTDSKLVSEDSDFDVLSEDNTFIASSQSEGIRKKLINPNELLGSLSDATTRLTYHCILLFGGRSKSNLHDFDQTCYFVYCYIVERETWHELGKMPAPRFDAATCLYGNGIYIAGGVDPRTVSFEGCGKASGNFWYLDISDWAWHALKCMPHARAGHCLVGLAKRLYAIGGAEHSFGNGLLSSVDAYDPDKGQWTRVCPLPCPLWKMAAASHGGCIWVCGGSVEAPMDFKGMVKDFTSDVYLYKRKTNKWVKADNYLLHECAMASLVEVKEDLVLVGGLTRSKLHNRQDLISNLDVFLRHCGQWVNLTYMKDGRFAASVVAIGNDIVIIGGRNTRFYPPLNKVEVFDFKNCVWKDRVCQLPVPISNSAAIGLSIDRRKT